MSALESSLPIKYEPFFYFLHLYFFLLQKTHYVKIIEQQLYSVLSSKVLLLLTCAMFLLSFTVIYIARHNSQKSYHGWHHIGKKTLEEINNPPPPLHMCRCLGKACLAPGGSDINIKSKGPNTSWRAPRKLENSNSNSSMSISFTQDSTMCLYFTGLKNESLA